MHDPLVSPSLGKVLGVMDAIQHQDLPSMVAVQRSDPVYMAHAHLTKVPVAAIIPFVEAFTQEGDVVVDPFAGSGMTGVAALITGRQARLYDISVLGHHIGTNYVRQITEEHLRKRADEVIDQARNRVGPVYVVGCDLCGEDAQVAKTVWSAVMECAGCASSFVYYERLEVAAWHKADMICPSCDQPVGSKCQRLQETPVVDFVVCECSRTQTEQPHRPPIKKADASEMWCPQVEIDKSRQMYVASALERHGLTSVESFFSRRNLCALAALNTAINEVNEPEIREKLRFVFTSILTRASKRYQWSRNRPLNAANANYYIAPVFYEWNVFELFTRKVDAAIRSDRWIQDQCQARLGKMPNTSDIAYERASAVALPLEDHSVDYVFTDPPFGANIFYSDMNLFQEAWLGDFTDPDKEAVIDRVDTGNLRTTARYEQILTDALRECHRVVKPGGFITLLFGNSSGKIWQLLQRSIAASGLEVVPEFITMLDKGQRSVKGLASGFENIATLDLVLTLREAQSPVRELCDPPIEVVSELVERHLATRVNSSPSLLYLDLLRHGFSVGWDLSRLDLRSVTEIIKNTHHAVDRRSALVTTKPGSIKSTSTQPEAAAVDLVNAGQKDTQSADWYPRRAS